MQISIDLKTHGVNAMLNRVLSRMGNKSRVMRTLGEIVRSSVDRNFARQGRPLPWKPSRRAMTEGGQTLSDTARLRRSFTVDAGQDWAAVGTNVKYAGTHQLGARKGSFGMVTATVRAHLRGGKTRVRPHPRTQAVPWGDIPARPFLMVQGEDYKEMNEALLDFLNPGA